MPRAWAIRAVPCPIRPNPIMPIVFPAKLDEGIIPKTPVGQLLPPAFMDSLTVMADMVADFKSWGQLYTGQPQPFQYVGILHTGIPLADADS